MSLHRCLPAGWACISRDSWRWLRWSQAILGAVLLAGCNASAPVVPSDTRADLRFTPLVLTSTLNLMPQHTIPTAALALSPRLAFAPEPLPDQLHAFERAATQLRESELRESDQQGIASWYGPGLHGRRTASGERFDSNDFTAAHPSFAFGTRVCVRNAVSGKTVVVRINDRGPHVKGRIIDLSQAAAEEMGIKGLGIKPVELWKLSDNEQNCSEGMLQAQR